MSRDSLPVGVEILKEAAEAAAGSSVTNVASTPATEPAGAGASSNKLEDGPLKRQKSSSGAWQEDQQPYSRLTQEPAATEGENEEVSFVNKEFSIPALRLLNAEQLASCVKLFDRASRITGQEYLLLQSSLMDLSALLQMQHQRLLELREEMQQFAASEAAAASMTAASNEPHQKQDTFV